MGERLQELGSRPVFLFFLCFFFFFYILSHSVSSSHMLMNHFARGVYRSHNSDRREPYLVSVCCSSGSRKVVANSIAFFNPFSQCLASDRHGYRCRLVLPRGQRRVVFTELESTRREEE